MKNDKLALVGFSIKSAVVLAGIWYWYRYTERTVWGFLGIVLIVAPLLGWLVALTVLMPFVNTDELRAEQEAEELRRELESERRKQEFQSFIRTQTI